MELADLFRLHGKVALVTGASSGLGVEFARALALAGADLALLARRRERLERVAAELSSSSGVRALALPADVRRREEIERAVERASSELGPVEILVNNAGVAPYGPAETHSREAWREAVETNLDAVFDCCQIVGRRMIELGRGGRIVNVTSVFGSVACGIFRNVGYVATKAAVENLTRQLAVEWARHGITVNAIAPAWFPSEMNASILESPEKTERILRMTPMRRLGEPRELWTALLFLVSPYSSYVTGSVVRVDGGWTAW
ncbi:MAG: short-chain dehydrogenase [Candidatus Binatia bacterium]|nr:MAG: short-chain dehydrogenase [Candidatus Binatia bacterium]